MRAASQAALDLLHAVLFRPRRAKGFEQLRVALTHRLSGLSSPILDQTLAAALERLRVEYPTNLKALILIHFGVAEEDVVAILSAPSRNQLRRWIWDAGNLLLAYMQDFLISMGYPPGLPTKDKVGVKRSRK